MFMAKRRISYDLPLYVGVWVLNMAKMIMLRFVYDVIDTMIPRSRYQLCFMDTDSIYLGVSERNWEKAILPEFLPEYLERREDSCHLDSISRDGFYYPRTCCKIHAVYDKREPGLFNREYVGDRYIGLCSKTYCCQSDESGLKFSCKGIQRDKIREETYARYDRVLQSKESSGAMNMGFRVKENTVWTYQQFRKGLSYFYCKRLVKPDGVNTDALNLVLNPWK